MWGTHKILQCLLVLLLTVCWYENSWAVSASMKKPCADCHIMHDSQGGGGVAVDAQGVKTVSPQESLLNATCAGCHNGLNVNVATDPPFVVNLAPAPVYGATGTAGDTLAGGNFHWVAQAGGDLKGHNVVGVGADQTARIAPGDNRGGGVTYDAGKPLTCAGTYGCHGDNSAGMTQVKSIWGAHHGNVISGDPLPAVNGVDGASIATSYRFLDGIVGWEDADAEYQPDSTNHNLYKGVKRVGDGAADAKSISSLCARCHGNFHNGAGDLGVAGASFVSPWLRHPVDIDLGDLVGEYLQYGDGGPGVYNVKTPLARTDVSTTATSGTVTFAGGDALVTCISCHRAHGSPWDYSLRWDYQEWPGVAPAYNGCGDCHTAKN